MTFNYYEPPSEEVFNEIKRAAIELWRTYDDTYHYASDKVARIEHLKNIQDNAWYMVGMFDTENQYRLIHMLDEPTKIVVAEMLEWSHQQV